VQQQPILGVRRSPPHIVVSVLLIHILEHGYIQLIVTGDWSDKSGRGDRTKFLSASVRGILTNIFETRLSQNCVQMSGDDSVSVVFSSVLTLRYCVVFENAVRTFLNVFDTGMPGRETSLAVGA